MLPNLNHRALVSPLVLFAALAVAGAARASDAAHDKPAKPAMEKPTAKLAEVPAKEDAESLQKLRERLAEKLGAIKPAPKTNPHIVHVATRSGAVEAEHAPVKRAAAAGHMATAKKPPAAAAHAPHWSYSGEAGPKAWGGLRADFSACAVGSRQSPIDIRGGIAVDLDPVQFDYRATPFRVIDNGHTVQVNVEPGNSIIASGRRFELLQFHFHRPSEERINGRQFDMVAHLVHKDLEGRLAVVAVLLDRGSAQPLVQTVWNNLPLEKGEEVAARAVLDLNHLLPPDRGYYTYMGSLTTPPCSEGVLWMVMRQPVPVSPEQIDIFTRMYPMNARPIQSAAGRMIKQSN